MTTSPESKLSTLKLRARSWDRIRSFFHERHVLEVDCPALSRGAPIDLHIDPMSVHLNNGEVRYLHTSPEYAMKRLLSLVHHDIYQLSHVFRHEELGSLHNPEFSLLEWYRIGWAFDAMIQETLQLISHLLGPLSHTIMTYEQLFQQFLHITPSSITREALFDQALASSISLPEDASTWDKDTLLQLLLSSLIEPHLGKDHLFVLTHFPPSQAALATTCTHEGIETALRFEVYYQGVELANGYEELTSSTEQAQRFLHTNEKRALIGKEKLPIDVLFLEALQRGLPPCCGVAVGFDRLVQFHIQAKELSQILPWSWEEI